MLFTPKCPVDQETKEWIEKSFLWLLDHFGEDAFRKSEIIFPTNKGFPERLFAEQKSIHAFLEAICGFMDVEYKTVSLKVFANTGHDNFHPLATSDVIGSRACGLYYYHARKHKIAIDQNLLATPAAFVATIAHELAHARLDSDLVPDSEADAEELLTDLATIFLGMGIFTANSIFGFDQFRSQQNQGWRATGMGYIDEETAGYALALFAYMKGETKPVWAKYLETNPKHFFKQGLKYLVKTGDTKVKVIEG
jgi:hypothetical protein